MNWQDASERERDERDLMILQMYDDGWSQREIAKHLTVSVGTVGRVIRAQADVQV